MADVSRKMNFEVCSDLKNPTTFYEVEIDLEREVDSYTREAAIALTGSIVRNNFKNIYGKVMDNNELAQTIKEKINNWLPQGSQMNVTRVAINPIQHKTRA